ncbi:hypothetical protein TRFO_32993 [Tritrichomonas foetus]|uniref:Uncharacterized protein n=1 Tax=Tritrichomonas foetus TaxID=1144522 RepID=A0A1J4JNU2_9EUKA|nr:hypothetical protein TRFO_32993 [Tritrichomonas foetus]|eukprot:OHT00394.1 hypothetical protein TRFO_32993 [Tritrichomonas foetus]
MKTSIQAFIYHIDPCLFISILMLIILIPVGFTVDKNHLEKSCNKGPDLFLPSDITKSVPEPFVDFVQKAENTIELVVSQFNPHHNFQTWVDILKIASKRNVKVSVITDDKTIYDALNFTDITFKNSSSIEENVNMFVFFAQSDFKRTIYASRLFNDWRNISSPNFILSFSDCKSLAKDASSLFHLLKYYCANGFNNHFLNKFLPGFSFPNTHKWPQGSCSFGISPPLLKPPGRKSVYALLKDFFNSSCENLRILTPSLFPNVEEVHQEMPELLLSEQIEQAAFQGSNIKILLTSNSTDNSELNSLKYFPRIEVKTNTFSYSPTFYLHGSECGFMPMPFQNTVSSSSITFSIRIKDKNVTDKLSDHFDKIWNEKESK